MFGRILKIKSAVISEMGDLYTSLPDSFNEHHKRNFNRLLKRLKIALFIWFFFFVATVIWFTCGC